MAIHICARFSCHIVYPKDLQKVAIITGATVAGAIIVPVAVAAFGFSTGGVVAGKSPNI